LIGVQRPRLVASAERSSATQHELDLVERRIRELQQTLMSATVVAQSADDVIRFGANVTVRDSFGDEERYRIVGPDEIDLARNWISSASPMARALINHRAGEQVSFESPAGTQVLDILAISYE
jgi:transcription elongation factor GreB